MLLAITVLAALAGVGFFFLFLRHQTVSPLKTPVTATQSGGTATGCIDTNGSLHEEEVLVLFGSQTGTAELFAKTLAREAVKLGVPVRLCDVENYESDHLPDERLVILLCATYGEGEPTDSMKNFHDWITDDSRIPGEELSSVKYTVFGLGDKQYKYFCEESIVMDRRFDELGAQRIYGMCCGDAGSGQLEEQFDEWCRELWPVVGRTLNITLKAHTEEPVEPECIMKYWEEAEAPFPFPKMASVLEPTQRLPAWVPLVQHRELLRDCSSRSTLEIAFDISNTIISYQAGDHLGILPCNPDTVVDDYLRILGISEEQSRGVFSLQDRKTFKNAFPARVSVRTALKWYVDLCGQPRKSTLRAFAQCCVDAQQKEELLRILRVEPEAQKEFTKLSGKLRTMHGFLRKYHSVKVPLAFFFELMPRIAPRYFSISSDSLDTPKKVSITVSVVEGGLCTSMLKRAVEGDKLPIFVRKSTFHLPLRHKDRPVIMIGPGTGVAPFIGFIHRRRAWLQKKAQLGKAMLFFGCRRSYEDHIYEDLCNEAIHHGILSVLDVAYSREQSEKVYVQHRLQKRASEVWDILEKEKGNLYICGDAKHMAKDVEQELLRIAQAEGGLSSDEAIVYMKQLEAEERFFKDVWSTTI